VRLKSAEALLKGKTPTRELLKKTGEFMAGTIKPVADVRSTREYRIGVTPSLFNDVFTTAWSRAGGENV
jgi:CO/xanthine dehydrogenase FAD-binding subunit